MKRKIIKILLSLFIAPILTLSLLSCGPDLGKFDLEKKGGFDELYGSVDDIKVLFENTSGFEEESFKFKTLTNEYTINNLYWENTDDVILNHEYVYIIIPFKSDMKIEELALYVQSDSNVPNNVGIELEFSAFYFKNSDSCPNKDKLKKMSDPDTKIEKDINNNDVEVEIEYADPKKEARVAYSTVTSSHSFESFVLGGFHQTLDIGEGYVSDGCLLVKDGSYLYLRVENNSALNRNMTPVAISFINLLFKAE